MQRGYVKVTEQESKANFEMEYNDMCSRHRMYVMSDPWNYTVVTHTELEEMKKQVEQGA